MRFLVVLGLLFGLSAALVGAVARPEHVSACRLIEFENSDDPRERVRFAVEALSNGKGDAPFGGLILVGEVTSETRVDISSMIGHYERSYEVLADQTKSDEINGYYRSVVKPLAMLQGDWPGGTIEMFLQPNPECFGGPRLKEGERVLLFLAPTLIAFNGSNRQQALWELQPLVIGGKVVIEDGQAFVHDLYRPSAYQPAGDAAAMIREVAALVDASPAQEKLALAAVDTGDSDRRAFVLVAVLAVALLVSALASLALAGHRR